MIVYEIISHKRLMKLHIGEINLKKRLARRIVGLVFLLIASVLIYLGLNYIPLPTPAVYKDQALLWATVVGLVFLSVLLAIWDAVDNARHIGKLADQLTRENLENIKKMIEKEESEKIK